MPDIRRAHIEDLTAIASIAEGERLWSKTAIGDVLQSSGVGWIIERQQVICGFCIGQKVGDAFEILQLGVDANLRRQGLATRLLLEAVDWARSQELSELWLETAYANSGAVALYHSFGMKLQSVRRNYYTSKHSPSVRDDACLFGMMI